MSVKRRDLVNYLEDNGFSLLREGKKHSIYTNGERTVPVKRHRVLEARCEPARASSVFSKPSRWPGRRRW